MRMTTLCLACLISLPPLIRWTMMFWPSTYRGRTGYARPRLIGFGPISAIADRQSSMTGSFRLSALSAVASLKVPCSGRYCCILVRLLYLGEIAASLSLSSHFYADDSQLYTWALHRQFHSSGVVWNLVLSGSSNGCVPTDCGSTPRRRTSCGAQPTVGP